MFGWFVSFQFDGELEMPAEMAIERWEKSPEVCLLLATPLEFEPKVREECDHKTYVAAIEMFVSVCVSVRED